MNKLNVSTSASTNRSHYESEVVVQVVDEERPRHLIVLIPPDSDYTTVTRRIWRLANETASGVQLLGLARDSSQEMGLRRDLATMSALIQDPKVFVETKVEVGNNWLGMLKQNYQEGDMIVCLAEQPIGILRKPLSQILESNFKAPIYVLSDLRSPTPQSHVLSQVIAWAGFLGIVVSFFVLQVKIAQMPDDWFQTVVSVLLLLPELGLILLWNSLF
jgi:hypothetical protein